MWFSRWPFQPEKVYGLLLQQLWKIDRQDLLGNSSDYVTWCHTVSCPTVLPVNLHEASGQFDSDQMCQMKGKLVVDLNPQKPTVENVSAVLILSGSKFMDNDNHLICSRSTEQNKQNKAICQICHPVCPTDLLYTQQLLAQIFQPRVANGQFPKKVSMWKMMSVKLSCHLRGIIT